MPAANDIPIRSVDPPARIAILGAGPIGIEAGLYARYLGYDVVVLERGELAANVQRWGHVQLSSPFSMSCSPLGLAALAAQDSAFRCPAADTLMTGSQWADCYLIPLASTDLLADHIRTRTTAVVVQRHPDYNPDHAFDEQQDAEHRTRRFRIITCGADGRECQESADVVIDASGVFGYADGCGSDGKLVDGESQITDQIEYGIPDVLGSERSAYESKRILVVGDTIWMTMTLIGLSKLIDESPTTCVTWIVPHSRKTSSAAWAAESPLPERRRLAQTASQLVCGSTPNMRYRPGTTIASVRYDVSAGKFVVATDDDPASGSSVPDAYDRMVVNTGFHRDISVFGALRPDMPVPSSVPESRSDDDVELLTDCSESGGDPESHFYLLGAKSFGRNSRFLYSQGLVQIRQLFAGIGGRADLDLYGTATVDHDQEGNSR